MSIEELWADYAEKFNYLCSLMREYGIDTRLLTDVIKAAADLQKFT